MAQASLDLIEAAARWLKKAWPTTVRGVCYYLFGIEVIASMEKKNTDRVSDLLTRARERGLIPWEWLVDGVREREQVPSWDSPAAYVAAVRRSWRLNFWAQQPQRVEVWSEKSTRRGILKPVLDEYGVAFLLGGGTSGATPVHDVAADEDKRPLVILYLGDFDPSGMAMTEKETRGNLRNRLVQYGGDHVRVERIALTMADARRMPQKFSFPAADKGPRPGSKGDANYPWFVAHYGDRCWELDAMDPRALRRRLRARIEANILDRVEWERCARVQRAEAESLQTALDAWPRARREHNR